MVLYGIAPTESSISAPTHTTPFDALRHGLHVQQVLSQPRLQGRLSVRSLQACKVRWKSIPFSLEHAKTCRDAPTRPPYTFSHRHTQTILLNPGCRCSRSMKLSRYGLHDAEEEHLAVVSAGWPKAIAIKPTAALAHEKERPGHKVLPRTDSPNPVR